MGQKRGSGGVDKGLGLHVLTSLSRVAVGYGAAAIVGIALGVLVGQSIIISIYCPEHKQAFDDYVAGLEFEDVIKD